MKRIAILGLFLLLTLPSFGQDSNTINVNVKLVNVYATVTDEYGAPVAGLTKDDFEVLEDGKPQKIAIFSRESAVPLSILLAIDTSLSTRKDLALELASAKRFAHDIVRPVDGLSVYGFNESVNQETSFTANLKTIDRAIGHLQMGSATALYDAIYLGSEALEKRQGRKVMVVITDGGDTVSQVNYQDAVRQAQEAEAVLYSIIIVPIEANAGRDTGGEHALIQLSRDTGGRHFYASSESQLDTAFHAISEELRTQYLLAYYPAQKMSSSEYRQIEVDVTGKQGSKMQVRHRSGYYGSEH